MWTVKTVLTLSLCFLEDLLFGGTIYGWPSLAYIYRDQGFFACDNNQTDYKGNNTIGCPDQDLYLPLGLTVGLVGLGLGAFPLGLMFDKYGLKITRMVTIVIGVSGSLFLAFANSSYPNLIFPGTFLTGAACISMIAINHHVALLAGKRAPVFNILYSGAINSAGIVYFLIKLGYDNGFSQRWSLLILSSLWIVVALTTFLLLPQFKIQLSEETHDAENLEENGNLERKQVTKRLEGGECRNVEGNVNLGATWTLDDLTDKNYGTGNEKNTMVHDEKVDLRSARVNGGSQQSIFEQSSPPVKSLWHYMFSFDYISNVVYLSLVHVWISLVLAIMNTWLTHVYEDDTSKVSYYTNVYAYVMFACGFLISPFAGGLTDGVRCLLEGKSHGNLRTLERAMVTVPGLIMSSMFGILVAVFMLLDQSWSTYPVFIFTEVVRGFLYGNVVAYTILVFPMEYFGVLHGVMFAVTGLTLTVQYGYVRWVETAGYTPMVSFQLAMVILSLLHPAIITIRYLRERRSNITNDTRL